TGLHAVTPLAELARVRGDLAYYLRGRANEAEAQYARSERLARKLGHLGMIGTVLKCRADLARIQGRPDDAAALYDEAEALQRRNGSQLGLAHALHGRGRLLHFVR